MPGTRNDDEACRDVSRKSPIARVATLRYRSAARWLVFLAFVSAGSVVSAGSAAASGEDAAPTLGALVGRVRLAGDAAVGPTPVRNATDPAACGEEQSLEDLLVSAENRGVSNVILSVDGVPASKVPSLAPRRLVLDNVGCRFVPHAAVLTVGSTIVAVNQDAFLHTTHLYGAAEMNMALPRVGSQVARIVKKPGMIVVKCDLHAWMQAFIRVDPHPYHAVSDLEGRFRIADIPPGSYVVESWHERLGKLRRPVHVEPGRTVTVEIEYQLK